MTKIFLDLDGVIYRFQEALYDEYVWYKEYGGTFSEFWENPPLNEAQWKYFLNTPIIYERYKCDAEIRQALLNLAEMYEIIYVTSRPLTVERATKNWLRREALPECEIFFVKDKGELAVELQPAFAVDDLPKIVDQYKRVGLPCFIVNQLWNKDYTGYGTRINSIKDLLYV